MGTSATPRYFVCEKGHPVREGSTLCLACGSPVTERTASVAGRRRGILAASVAGVVAIAGAALAIGFAVSEGDAANPGGNDLRTACGGLADAEMLPGDTLEHAPAVTCFVVPEEARLTVGATTRIGADLRVEITDDAGLFWAAANDAVGSDPEATRSFLPGTYVVTVEGLGGDPPGDFDLYVRLDGGFVPDPSLPDEDACGSIDIPLIVADGTAPLEGVTGPYACLAIAESAFVKVGLIGEAGSTADLNLAIHTFISGRPVFLRSVDDSFGTDPEMNLALDPGRYLLEVATWNGAPLDTFAIYVDVTRTYFRTGGVSPPFAAITAHDCVGAAYPTVPIGGQVKLPEGVTVACVTIPDGQRVALGATSGSTQDLTLEVIGFADDGLGVRYGWADDDLWATRFDEVDPRLDLVLPAGTYALAIGEYSGSVPSDVRVTVDDDDP